MTMKIYHNLNIKWLSLFDSQTWLREGAQFLSLEDLQSAFSDVPYYYYAQNMILNSDWLNTYLTLDDVWLVGSNVRQRNLMSG